MRHEFRREGHVVRMELQARLFLRQPGALISGDTIVEEIWQGRIVSEAAISSCIDAFRRALIDSGRDQAILATVPQRLPLRRRGRDGPARRARATPPAAQRIRYARSRDGTAIARATTGSGPPLLCAGHFLTDLEYDWQSLIWRPFLDRLGRHFSVTRYDQRTTGLSADAVAGPRLETLVEDIMAVAVGLGCFPVLAASQGVPVSIAFAARHPERVSRLVLYGGYAQGRNLRDAPDEREGAEAVVTFIREGWGKRSTPSPMPLPRSMSPMRATSR